MPRGSGTAESAGLIPGDFYFGRTHARSIVIPSDLVIVQRAQLLEEGSTDRHG